MPEPMLSNVTPSIGWPGGTRPDGTTIPGTSIIIQGRFFHPTPEMHLNRISFENNTGGRINAPVEWASVNEIDYQPNGIFAEDLHSPRGLAMDRSGNLFIADTDEHRIVKISNSGTISFWGSQGGGNAQFERPTGVASDIDGNIYVADTMNHRVQKFDNNGGYLAQWGSHGSGIGELDGPVDIDVGRIGGTNFVYVADSNNHRLSRTSDTGEMATQLVAPPDTGRILGVSAPNTMGYVYATDPVNKRIFRWAWHGIFNGSYGPMNGHTMAEVDFSFPMGITQDFDGYVYVVDQGDRVVKKYDPFDPEFREIARFGLTPTSVPGEPVPEDQFVDPVALAVTDLKAVYVADRSRNHVVLYTPTDSQEIWVNVPEGAVSGPLEVQTDEGTDSIPFNIWHTASMELADSYMTQGLVEYPYVAGKKTVIRYQFRTLNESVLHNFNWGSPATDSAVCTILREGSFVGEVEGISQFNTGTGGFMGTEIGFEIHFKIPCWIINEPANYRFEVSIIRTGIHVFSHNQSFDHYFTNRKSYNILSSPVTHLAHDGTRVRNNSSDVALFYVGNEEHHFLDWMDWSRLYSGYINYNRLYPLRHGLGNISDYGIWPNASMHNGINNTDETRRILLVLEMTRRRINEDYERSYDYMMGVVLRDEIHLDWAGVTSPDYNSIIVSLGDDNLGDPAYDMGHIIGHELLHQHGADHQSADEITPSAKDAWNSYTECFIPNPLASMFVAPLPGGRSHYPYDEYSFVGTDNYERLYDALANPHPKFMKKREQPLKDDKRPRGSNKNFTLIGSLKKNSGFDCLASWIGKKSTPVTPEAEDDNLSIIFLDNIQNRLLEWKLSCHFGLSAISKERQPSSINSSTALVSLTIPFMEGTETVELHYKQQVVWTTDIPEGKPAISLITPQKGETLPVDKPLHVSWQSTHPQGMEQYYIVEYSHDGGKYFKPITSRLKETSCDLLPGLATTTGKAHIRVNASDGFNQATTESIEIKVGKTTGRLAIVRPKPGEIIPEGKEIKLTAVFSDTEEGFSDLNRSNTRWILDDEIILGPGNDISVKDMELKTPKGEILAPLETGPHKLSVEVTPAPGIIKKQEISITIAADSDRDGIPDDVEIASGTDPADPGDGSSIRPRYEFGQWRFRKCAVSTLFQIAHHGTGTVLFKLKFIEESGKILKNHPLQITEGSSKRESKTDSNGDTLIKLKSFESAMVLLKNSDKHRQGFGISYISMDEKSFVQETLIQAHAWVIRRKAFFFIGWESQGSIQINKGKPFKIRKGIKWSGYSPSSLPPSLTHRVLGKGVMAASRISRMLYKANQSEK